MQYDLTRSKRPVGFPDRYPDKRNSSTNPGPSPTRNLRSRRRSLFKPSFPRLIVWLLNARQTVIIAFAPDQRPAFVPLELLHSANQDEMISGFDNLVK